MIQNLNVEVKAADLVEIKVDGPHEEDQVLLPPELAVQA